MPVRVRDLEIALVLAREMKAAAARSVDASLRLDQLQEVFGVEELDRAERARIQTALQMAGLEPFPSLLEADPSTPIRFGASQAAAAEGATAAAADPAPPAEEPPAEAPPTFPTVGQFARSKLRRSRRFGGRRGHQGDRDVAPPPPVDETPDAPEPPEALPAEEPLYRHGDALADEVEAPEAALPEEVTRTHEAPAEYAESNGHGPEHAELDPDATQVHYQVEPEEAEQEEAIEEPEVDEDPEVDEEPELGEEPEPHPEDEREYIPLVPPPVATAAPEPEPAAPTPSGARTREVVAALLPAVVIPVIVTSVAGWRFGLPFVALSVIATGVLLGRRADAAGDERRGLFATLRGSPAAQTALRTTAVVTVLSVVASVVLASVGKDSSSTTGKSAAPAKKSPPSAAAKPAPAAKPATKKKPSAKPKSHKQTPPPTTPEPQPDPSTQGLVRVPPSSAAQPSTGTGTGTQPGAGTSTTPQQSP
jgi:hypothetical protein